MRMKFDIYAFITNINAPWKESLNSDVHQFYHCQQNEHSSVTLTALAEPTNNIMTYDVRNIGPG